MTKDKKPKEKYKYVLPNGMAKAMGKISMRTQMEASMLSQFLLIIGLSIMVIFNLIFGEGSWGYKIIITFNLLCGWILISSYLVTTYQQYISYMSAMGYDPEKEKQQIKSQGNLIQRIKKAKQRKKELKIKQLKGGIE